MSNYSKVGLNGTFATTGNSSIICDNGFKNSTHCGIKVSKPYFSEATAQILHFVSNNKQTLLNSAIAFCVLTAIVMVFFIVKAIRLRRVAKRSKRYGLVDADKLEMQRLGADDDDEDDEDITVFDVNRQGGRLITSASSGR